MSTSTSQPRFRPLDDILELARWAPSGDNTQPWRFAIVDERHVEIHGFDTREHSVYDLDGHSSQIALGALIETAAIAASVHGLRIDAMRRVSSADEKPIFDLRFIDDSSIRADELVTMIPLRSVQRRAMSTRPITASQKEALMQAVQPDHTVVWLEGTVKRLRTARLMFRSAKLRLTMPEAYRVHRDVIEWNSRFSTDRVPDRALGVGRATLFLMRFVMHSWSRVHFFNRFLAGTWIPRVQMDVIPAIACGAHFLLVAHERSVKSLDDYVRAGRAIQRFWLEATRLGLSLQPELTPLIFARYARAGTKISATEGIAAGAKQVASDLDSLLGKDASHAGVFIGRLGTGTQVVARSTRRSLRQLMATAHVSVPSALPSTDSELPSQRSVGVI